MTAIEYHLVDGDGEILAGPFQSRVKAMIALKDAHRDGVDGATLTHRHIGATNTCPTCGAKDGDPCVTKSGLPAAKNHKARK